MKRNRPINADAPPTPPPAPAPEAPTTEAPIPRPPRAKEPPAPEPSPPKAAPAPEAKKRLPPPPAEPKPAPDPTPKPPAAPEPTPRRRRIALTPILLAGLVLVAIAFILAAVIGGSGGAKKSAGGAAPAPAPAAGTATGGGAEELGYPSFATNNTTRIGGADPAANAAAVALAVFPARTPAQRPSAVTLVGEEDWAGAIAAAVLMAEPVGAPILYSAAGGAPAATNEALAALAPAGDKSTGGASAFSIGALAAPLAGKVTKVPGGSAAAEAAAIAKLRDRLVGSPPRQIVIAPASQPEIAAPAAAWAARSGDPVLFANAESLPRPTVAYLRAHVGVPVYVLGPTSAISSAVFLEIAKIGEEVKRVAGKTAVENAIAFARFSDGEFGWDINDPGHGFVLARSNSPLDAAAAAPLSASGTWGPLLLTDGAAKVPAELRSYLLDLKPGYTTNPTRAFYNHVWLIGDQEAIDVNQQAEVNDLAELAKIKGGAQ